MGALARLNHYYRDYAYLFIPGLLCAIVSAVFQITVPMVVRQVIDSIPRFVRVHGLFAGSDLQGDLYGYFFGGLLLFGLLIIALSLLSGVFSFLMRRTVVVASRHIEYDLRNRLYEHLQRLSPAFYQSYSTGDVITRSTSDIENVRRYIGPAVMYAARALTIVITAVTTMLIISPRLTLFALLPMPLLAVSIFFVSRMVHTRTDAKQKQYSKLTSRVQEAFSGIRVLKAYTREEHEASEFEQESESYRERMMALARVDATWRPLFLLLVGLSTIVVVWYGGHLAMQGAITIGNIAEYILYVTIMTWPVASLGYIITMMQQGAASMERLGEIFDAEPAIADTERTDASVEEVRGSVTFENVWFRYDPPQTEEARAEREGDLDGEEVPAWVLEDISFSIEAGQTLGIVGRTGAGKSTLVEMMLRLIEPTRGRVLVDGRDVREIPLGVLRRSTGYVPQEVFLFSDTIQNNIAFGEMEAPEQDVRRAAEEADLLENVESFPEGFETFVGERGITLSGGQKQRTSIARAVIRRPSLLVLDDALSAVDTDTEQRILKHIKAQYGERTIVIVAHRISAVQEADLILVLEDGRITQRGRHEELLEDEGLYASLYHKQQLQEEIESL